MFTLSGTPDVTPHEEFMIVPIHYIYTLPNASVYNYVYGLTNILAITKEHNLHLL